MLGPEQKSPRNQTDQNKRKTETHREWWTKIAYLSFEVMLVLEDGVVVSVHADTIREHLLLVVEKSVGTEVLCKIQFLVHHRHRSSSSITGSASVPRHDAVLVAPHVTAKTLEALPKKRQRQRQKKLWVEFE